MQNKIKKIFNLINAKKTALGVGPMSKNVVDTTIKISEKFNIPIMLIASRRQIECKEFSGGYVNSWDTESFAKYVLSKDKKKNIILCRDHGGMWQNDFEKQNKLSFNQCYETTKKSFKTDIDNNFSVIHIDTSEANKKKISLKENIYRFIDLYEYCLKSAKKSNKKIVCEMGTEEQSGFSGNSDDLENGLSLTKIFCKKKNLPYPAFVVIQAGTKVMQKRNIGSFASEVRIKNEIPIEIQLIKSLELCKKYGIFMKEHNADFLDENSLSWHPKLGIHAANVAPEFAITETKALLDLLNYYKLSKIKQEFINISVRSNKWKKWTLKGSKLSDLDKTLLCGHYNFSKKNFKILKEDLNNFLKAKKRDLNHHLKTKIEINILKYLKNFRVINNV